MKKVIKKIMCFISHSVDDERQIFLNLKSEEVIDMSVHVAVARGSYLLMHLSHLPRSVIFPSPLLFSFVKRTLKVVRQEGDFKFSIQSYVLGQVLRSLTQYFSYPARLNRSESLF